MVNRGGGEGGRRRSVTLPGLPDEPPTGISTGREGTEPPGTWRLHTKPGVRRGFGQPRDGRAAPAPPGCGERHSGTDGLRFSLDRPFPPTHFPARRRHRPVEGRPAGPGCTMSPGRGPRGEAGAKPAILGTNLTLFLQKNGAAEPLSAPRQSHRADTEPCPRKGRRPSETGSSAALPGAWWVPAAVHGSLRSRTPAQPAPTEPKKKRH